MTAKSLEQVMRDEKDGAQVARNRGHVEMCEGMYHVMHALQPTVDALREAAAKCQHTNVESGKCRFEDWTNGKVCGRQEGWHNSEYKHEYDPEYVHAADCPLCALKVLLGERPESEGRDDAK